MKIFKKIRNFLKGIFFLSQHRCATDKKIIYLFYRTPKADWKLFLENTWLRQAQALVQHLKKEDPKMLNDLLEILYDDEFLKNQITA